MRPLVFAILMCLGTVGIAGATSVRHRTERVSTGLQGDGPNGGSARPSIDGTGTVVAFDSIASNLVSDPNGPISDVFRRDLKTGRTTLVSAPAGGGGADGPSDAAVVSADGTDIVFTSRARNLVAGDSNEARDIFLSVNGRAPVRISVGADGAQANAASFQPDISADGRRVVFTSFADNLVAADTNGVEDVFVRDLSTGRTRRVSERAGVSLKGRSRAPAISPDGRWVVFESTAADVVSGDRNRVADVFLADLSTGSIRRVSVSSRERQQNRAVAVPFVTVADVSRDGRYVTWDSDATNLVPGDRNRDTDVFVRDVRRGRTELVSRSATGRQGDNDSYLPAISQSGRYVTFSSFARNLWPQDRAGEDVFLHDRRLDATTPLTVTSTGRRRGSESDRQLLRRAAMSDHAGRVAFTSTARLVAHDRGAFEDVFVRRMDAPAGRIARGPAGTIRTRRPRYRLTADDPAAVFLCQIDRRAPFFCPRAGRLPRLGRGRHRLAVRAGGPGMHFDRSPAFRAFRVR